MTRSIARRPARVIAASLICVAAGGLGPIAPRLAAQVPEATDVLDRTSAAAEASLRLGELQVAESHYRHALMHGWMMVGALHVAAGRLPDARQAFARASSSSVDNRIALQSLAIVQLQTGEGDQAIETLTRMASSAPRDVQLRLTLAQALVVDRQTRAGSAGARRGGRHRAGRPRAAVRAGGRLPPGQEGGGGRGAVRKGRRRRGRRRKPTC